MLRTLSQQEWIPCVFRTITQGIYFSNNFFNRTSQSLGRVTIFARRSVMLKKILATIGIGGAKIDLQLDRTQIRMGENVNGIIQVVGGSTEQSIDRLTVELRVSSKYTSGERTVFVNEKVASVIITDEDFILHPGETREFPFQFTCPERIPVSSVTTNYYFQTNLDIESAIDAKDRDFVQILPNGLQRNFLEGFARLGFTHYSEGYTGYARGIQMIQFKPTTWLRGKYDEIVFHYSPANSANQISGFFELDKKTKGLLGAIADELDLDERKGRYYFTAEDLATPEIAEQTIRNFIIKNSEGLYG